MPRFQRPVFGVKPRGAFPRLAGVWSSPSLWARAGGFPLAPCRSLAHAPASSVSRDRGCPAPRRGDGTGPPSRWPGCGPGLSVGPGSGLAPLPALPGLQKNPDSRLGPVHPLLSPAPHRGARPWQSGCFRAGEGVVPQGAKVIGDKQGPGAWSGTPSLACAEWRVHGLVQRASPGVPTVSQAAPSHKVWQPTGEGSGGWGPGCIRILPVTAN